MISVEVQAVRALVAALNEGDVEGYLSGFSSDSLRWVRGLDQPFTKADIREQLRALAAAFEPLVLEEQLVFGSDGHVCARWLLRGTLAATGRAVEVETLEVYAFEGSTITGSHVYGDVLGILRQLEEPG